MMVDRDFKITYLNQRSLKLLQQHEALFRKHWPNFNAQKEALIGTCIDMFHKDPNHQRQLLSNPANLPYKTTITIDDVSLELNVSALIDESGNYIGNTLEWDDVTEVRKNQNEVARLKAAVGQAMTAMVMIDRDFNITYMNGETLTLFRKYEAEFRSVWPGFTASEEWLMGRCIDDFHRNPAHQRAMLADPGNLPYSTDISVGDIKIELNVSAIMDSNGQYIGNTLEWRDVTAIRANEIQVGRLVSAVEGMTTNLMMADKDGIIQYLNPSLKKLLNSRASELRGMFPGFDVDALVGRSIDSFHKNPAHQRGIISDPSRMPYTANIRVGSLSFSLTCIAMHDSSGNFIGPACNGKM